MPDLKLAILGNNHVDAAVAPDQPKDVLKLGYTGNAKNVPAVFISLIEVDEGEALGEPKRSAPKGQRPKGDLIAQFDCKISDGKLLLVSTTPTVPTLPASAPTIKVNIAGQDFDVKLPGVDQENGLFEIRVVAESKKGSSKPEFVSNWLAFARHFTAFPRPPGVKGAVLAFITGADEARFFTAATEYWKMHADAVFTRDGLSLEEIVQFLADHKDDFGGYGEVNIVTHGNRISALIRLLKDGERELRISRMREAFADPRVAAKFAAAGSMGLSSDSRVVFRACNIGNRPDLLLEVKSKVFNGACPVFAPKFLQGYDANGPKPIEFFSEDLAFFLASGSPLALAAEEARIRPLFLSQHPASNFEAERATFPVADRKHQPHDDKFPMTVSEEVLVDFSTGRRRTDASLNGLVAPQFDQVSAADDSRDFTKFAQWQAGPRKNEKVQPSQQDAVWVEPDGSGHRPIGSFITVGGPLEVGSDSSFGKSTDSLTAPADLQLSGSGIASSHATINLLGNQRVQIIGSGQDDGTTATFRAGGRTVSNFTARAPTSVGIGSVAIQLRRLQDVTFDVPITRFLTSWRRKLRVDSTAPYDKRTLVVPVVTQPSHFGSSEDKQPTRAELENLSK